MNRFFFKLLFLIFLSLSLSAQTYRSPLTERLYNDGWDIELLDSGQDADYLMENEKDVLLLMNACRWDPPKFAQIYVMEYKEFYNGKYLQFPGEISISTREGVAAVNELYRQMMAAPSRHVLSPSLGMSRAAADHSADQGPSGRTGHNSSDGSRFTTRIERYGDWSGRVGENISYGYSDGLKIVMQLMVDDGVSSRGHRKNIMNRDFYLAGISIGAHQRYGSMCVVDYAGEYRDF